MAPSFPAFLRLEGRCAAVVGGGLVGWHKARQLLACGARVRMVAPRFAEGSAEEPAEGTDAAPQASEAHEAHAARLERLERPFRPEDLDDCVLAVAATRDPVTQEAVVRAARERGVLCNVVDAPELCDFTYGAAMRRGSLQITVTTDGKFPILAQQIRDAIAADWPEAVGPILEALGEARASFRSRGNTFEENRARLRELLREITLERIRGGDTTAALESIERWTSSHTR